jgi:hypothetical protein
MDIDDLLNTPRFESLKRYLDERLFSYTGEETLVKLVETPKFESLKKYLDEQLLSYTSDETLVKLVEVFGGYHKAREWYYSKLQALGDKRPYDLCKAGKEDLIYQELVNIEHGSLC